MLGHLWAESGLLGSCGWGEAEQGTVRFAPCVFRVRPGEALRTVSNAAL